MRQTLRMTFGTLSTESYSRACHSSHCSAIPLPVVDKVQHRLAWFHHSMWSSNAIILSNFPRPAWVASFKPRSFCTCSLRAVRFDLDSFQKSLMRNLEITTSKRTRMSTKLLLSDKSRTGSVSLVPRNTRNGSWFISLIKKILQISPRPHHSCHQWQPDQVFRTESSLM